MIVSRDPEKSFGRVQHPFILKALRKQGIDRKHFNKMKSICGKPIAGIAVNGEKQKPFPLEPWRRQGRPLSSSIQYRTGISSQSSKARERNKKVQFRNKEAKLALFTDVTILYLTEPGDSIKTLLHLINTFGKVEGHKINIQNSVPFLYTNNRQKRIQQIFYSPTYIFAF
jgi:hypothetical protein